MADQEVDLGFVKLVPAEAEESEPSSPLPSALQHEIEWCRSYPATNSNWVPVRFSFDGRNVPSR